MAVLLAVVIALTVVNLVLLLGVVRRLREHDDQLAKLAVGGAAPGGIPELIAPVGSRVGSFAVRSVDGLPVGNGSLPAGSLVGFFSPGCDTCHERVPDFVRAGAELSERALAVVVEDGRDPASLVADLGAVATVVLEKPGGALMEAFAVQGFPVFAIVGADGAIRASGYELPLQPV